MSISKYIDKYKNLPVQAKASFCFFMSVLLQKGISVITTPIFTRLLTTTEYGEFNIFNSWMSIIGVFVTLRLSYGVYEQGLVKFKDNRKVFVSAIQGLATTIMIISFIIYILNAKMFNSMFSMNTYEMCAMFVIMWASLIYDFWAGEERVNFRYKKLVLISVIASILQPVIGIVVVLNFKNKVTARILSIAIINLIMYGGFFFLKLKEGKVFYSRDIWLYALKFNLPLIPHYLSQTVLNSADRIMIGKMIGDNEAGIYSLAYSLALLVTIINGAVMKTMGPWMYQKIHDKKIKDIEPIAYASLVLVAIINILLIAFAPEVIKIFAPAEYYNAIWIIPPVSMSVLFMYSYDLFAKYEFYYEKTVFIMVASIGGAILNVILNYIFIPQYGYLAAGYTTLVCFMLYTLGHYLFMNLICKAYLEGTKPYNAKVLLLIYASFMLVGFGLMLTYSNPMLRYLVITIILIGLMMSKNKFLAMYKEFMKQKKGEK